MHRNLLRQVFGVSGAAYDEPLIDSLIFPLREPSRGFLSMSLAAANPLLILATLADVHQMTQASRTVL
jgi:hypothetical protein